MPITMAAQNTWGCRYPDHWLTAKAWAAEGPFSPTPPNWFITANMDAAATTVPTIPPATCDKLGGGIASQDALTCNH